MEYPFIMAEVNKAIINQKKEPFPDGICGQLLKITSRHGVLALHANNKKYNKSDENPDMRKAAIDLMATLFIFIHEIEKQTK